MEHAHHFLSRLDRVSRPYVELALALYRDPDAVREVLRVAKVPERVERVALAMGVAREGPFIVVTRAGHFVTCLAHDMSPGPWPVVARETLDATVQKLETLRAHRSRAEQVLDAHEGAELSRLLLRINRAGDALCREEVADLVALSPLLFSDYVRALPVAVKAVDEGATVLHGITDPRPRDHAALEAHWRLSWAASHLAVIVGATARERFEALDRSTEPLEAATAFTSVIQLNFAHLMRGTWVAGRLGKPALARYKRAFDEATIAGEIAHRAAALAAMGFGHAKLRAEVRKALAPRALADDVQPDQLPGAELRRGFGGLYEAAFGYGPELAAHRVACGRVLFFRWAEQLDRAGPHRYARAEDVPEPVALAATMLYQGDPARDQPTMTLSSATVPWLARAAPEDLYLPRDALAAIALPWRPEATLSLLARFRATFVGRKEPVRNAQAPGRNEPCSCGSGKKFKRCCGA